MDVVTGSVAELDRCLGVRRSGMAVSGFWVPDFRERRTGEDPMHMTRRVMVDPMMSLLGYSPSDSDEGRVVLVTATMNNPLPSIASETVRNTRGASAELGIGSDGFGWVVVTRTSSGDRVRAVADLRPYYIEALERRRFRSAVAADTSAAESFLEVFSRDAQRDFPRL